MAVKRIGGNIATEHVEEPLQTSVTASLEGSFRADDARSR